MNFWFRTLVRKQSKKSTKIPKIDDAGLHARYWVALTHGKLLVLVGSLFAVVR